MSRTLISQGVVVAAAMVVSSAAIFLAFTKQRTSPLPTQLSGNLDSESSTGNLRSCLSSSGTSGKRERKKKRVKFAENVKEARRDRKEYRKERSRNSRSTSTSTSPAATERNCRNEIPANRMALYNGILRDRVHRMVCSY